MLEQGLLEREVLAQRKPLGWHGRAVVAAALLLLAAVVVRAADAAPSPTPPLGDCFGGLLTADPLHCYALEQAHLAGHIDVEAVYLAGNVLYFSLRQSEPVAEPVYAFLKAKAYEFFDTWPAQVPDNPREHLCVDFVRPRRSGSMTKADVWTAYRECVLERTAWQGGDMLPLSLSYQNVLFHTGGEAARRTQVGWASWRQVWPAGAAGVARDAPAAAAAAFDVSDVDTSNIPEPDCKEAFPGAGNWVRNSCRSWQRYHAAGSADLAGLHSDGSPERNATTFYFQVKQPPSDAGGLEALKETLFPEHKRHGYKVEIIPVTYDFGELWRWATILDRFVHSAGNTIGLINAEVGTNLGVLSESLWPLTELHPVPPAYGPSPSVPRAALIRETIIVGAWEPQVVVDALPVLLPALSIPVEAVGVVEKRYRGPGRTLPLGGGAAAGAGELGSAARTAPAVAPAGAEGNDRPLTSAPTSPEQPDAASAAGATPEAGIPMALVGGLAAGGALLALGAASILTIRRRRA